MDDAMPASRVVTNEGKKDNQNRTQRTGWVVNRLRTSDTKKKRKKETEGWTELRQRKGMVLSSTHKAFVKIHWSRECVNNQQSRVCEKQKKWVCPDWKQCWQALGVSGLCWKLKQVTEQCMLHEWASYTV